MELLFAHSYLILFGKLAVGGLLALAVPPFLEMERGFYRSTSAVYLALAVIMAGGEVYLWTGSHQEPVVSTLGIVTWIVFVGLFAGYVITLYIELPFLRARLFPSAVAAGFVALIVTAFTYTPQNHSVLAALPIAASICTGAAISGAALTGMLLGHWYLIDTGLDLKPFRDMLAFCKVCLAVQITTILVMAIIMWLWPHSPWQSGIEAAFSSRFALLLVARGAAWVLAVVLFGLITRTLAIPQTMATTGLFYIQAMVIAVGEICGQWLLFRTGVPL